MATTYATMLETAKENLAAALANPKPSYTVDGVTVNHDAHLAQLQASIEWLESRVQDENGPFEESTYLF